MSNILKDVIQECEGSGTCGAIETILKPRQRDLGGFSVRRVLPSPRQPKVGPWVFFDHMGPAHFQPGEGINVRPHPHIGIATVTYLFEGEILHRDSLGSEQLILPGDINLMICGRGIVHSEREQPELKARPHRQHGLQLWLALPESAEETEPGFHHYPGNSIPTATVDDVPVRVIMGSAYGVTSPVKIFSDTLYVEAHLQPGQRLALPEAPERAVYIAQGTAKAEGTEIPEFCMAVFSATPGVTVEAVTEVRLAIIGGEPFGERYIDWNFVSSRKERIEQARADWKAGRFPRVPGDEEEFIPLPE